MMDIQAEYAKRFGASDALQLAVARRLKADPPPDEEEMQGIGLLLLKDLKAKLEWFKEWEESRPARMVEYLRATARARWGYDDLTDAPQNP